MATNQYEEYYYKTSSTIDDIQNQWAKIPTFPNNSAISDNANTWTTNKYTIPNDTWTFPYNQYVKTYDTMDDFFDAFMEEEEYNNKYGDLWHTFRNTSGSYIRHKTREIGILDKILPSTTTVTYGTTTGTYADTSGKYAVVDCNSGEISWYSE